MSVISAITKPRASLFWKLNHQSKHHIFHLFPTYIWVESSDFCNPCGYKNQRLSQKSIQTKVLFHISNPFATWHSHWMDLYCGVTLTLKTWRRSPFSITAAVLMLASWSEMLGQRNLTSRQNSLLRTQVSSLSAPRKADGQIILLLLASHTKSQGPFDLSWGWCRDTLATSSSLHCNSFNSPWLKGQERIL